MPRCASTASSPAAPPSSSSHRYLPRRRASVIVRPTSRPAKSASPARWRRTARGWPTSTSTIVRFRTCSARPRRTTSTSGSSGTLGRLSEPAALDVAASFVSACHASSAAFCSASFLVRPSPDPSSRPPTTAVAVNIFRWSGPVLGDAVLRHAEIARGRELLEAGLPVQTRRRAAGRCASSAANSWCTTSRAGSSPCSRYTAPISASVASARMLGLVRPPVRSSPRPR